MGRHVTAANGTQSTLLDAVRGQSARFSTARSTTLTRVVGTTHVRIGSRFFARIFRVRTRVVVATRHVRLHLTRAASGPWTAKAHEPRAAVRIDLTGLAFVLHTRDQRARKREPHANYPSHSHAFQKIRLQAGSRVAATAAGAYVRSGKLPSAWPGSTQWRSAGSYAQRKPTSGRVSLSGTCARNLARNA